MSGFERRLAPEDRLDIRLSAKLAFAPGATSTTVDGGGSCVVDPRLMLPVDSLVVSSFVPVVGSHSRVAVIEMTGGFHFLRIEGHGGPGISQIDARTPVLLNGGENGSLPLYVL